MKIKRAHTSSSPKSENFAVSLVPLIVTSIAYSARALLFHSQKYSERRKDMRLQKEINIFVKEAMIKRFRAIETAVSVTKGNISAIISDSEIVELQNSETTMYSKLGKLDMSVSGLTQQYTDLTTKYDSVRDQYTAMDSKLASYKTSVDGLSANISQVSTRLNNNYSTTETMNAAISAAKDEISLSVSKTYDNKIASLESWRNETSAKITDSAIIATVKSSAEWSNKADKKSFISQINMSTENIAIRSSLIKLEGLVTANNYFRINTDGSMETKSATIGGWRVNDTAIYKDITSGSTTYRVWFQPPLTSYPDSTRILSCQKKTGSGSFIADFVLYSNGKAKFGTTYLYPDGSCTLGGKCKIGARGDFSLGYLALDYNGSLSYGKDNISFSGAGGSGATTLRVQDGHKPVTLGDGFITVQNNSNGNITKIEPVGITTKNLNATGTKKRIVDTKNYATRSLYCYEMPSPVFGDIGEAILDEKGKCIIMIDDIFSETIVTDIEYQVFLQKEGKGDIWVKEKNSNYFEINGTPGLKFAWEIKARQKDYETERLEIFDEEEFTDIDYALEAAEMVDNFYKELEVA